MSAKVTFLLFCALVLGAPAALMVQSDPGLKGLGNLALILGPGLVGVVLNRGLGYRGEALKWAWVGVAPLIALTIVGAALAAGLVTGASAFGGQAMAGADTTKAVGGVLLTSFLEELGWAGGGLALALRAFGRRWGVLSLGLVWAAWHLVPVIFRNGLFPQLEAAPPGMLAAFVAACVIYRELLTLFAERAKTWFAAGLAHAAPNVLITGLMASGLMIGSGAKDWPFYPAPGGLVFPLAAVVAVWLLRAKKPSPTARPSGGATG